jgi:hypothetical protein
MQTQSDYRMNHDRNNFYINGNVKESKTLFDTFYDSV